MVLAVSVAGAVFAGHGCIGDTAAQSGDIGRRGLPDTATTRPAKRKKAQPRRDMGAIVGTITMGPTSPSEGVDSGKGVPVPGARVVISTLQGQEISSVVTDHRGRYTVALLPGTYRVEVTSPPMGMRTKGLPATVTITSGQETHLCIGLDTGMR